MTYRIQRLGRPEDSTNPFSEGNLGFSKEIMTSVKQCFSFDFMGSSRFEWGEIPKSFFHVVEFSEEKKFFVMTHEANDKHIYALVPMTSKHAENARSFLLDQLSESPAMYCEEKTWIKETVFENRDGLIGWYDLDNMTFYFVGDEGYNALLKTQRLFGVSFLCPRTDVELNYYAQLGENRDSSILPNMRKLSEAFNRDIVCPEFNNKSITVRNSETTYQDLPAHTF